MTNQARIAVVIAAYNEGEVLARVVAGVPRQLPGIGTIDVVVVDDGSADVTSDAAASAGAIVLRHIINRGQGAALKTGLDYAAAHGYTVAVTFDADGQHDPSEIASLVDRLLSDNLDVVLGSRFLSKKAESLPPVRRLILKCGVLFTVFISRIKVTDTHNGFRAFRVSSLKRLKLVQDRMEHASEILDQISRQHLAYAEVPVTIIYSDYSIQKGQRSGNAVRIALKMIAHKLT
jgi:polyprenyl-phospho-N-acetylgalactosaminyl synthase